MCSFDESTSPDVPQEQAQPAPEDAGISQSVSESASRPEGQEGQLSDSRTEEAQTAETVPQTEAQAAESVPQTEAPQAAEPASQPEEEAPSDETRAEEPPAQPVRPRSPYENSPYTGFYDSHPQPEPKKPRHTRGKSAKRPARKRIAAIAAAVAVLAGSCALTYSLAAGQARAESARTVAALNRQLDDLQSQVNSLSRSTGASQIGTVPAEGLTPAQVYARNVDSVVAISCDARVTMNGQSMEATVTGSGFVLTEDGYIVTNYHVVEDAASVTVTTQDDEEFSATVIGHDSTADMALLKVDAEGLQAVTLGSSSELIIGDMVVAIGNPLGTLNATQTVGYISGINRQISSENNYTTMLQTDAAINSGNSGGPLFNMKGEVVGITTAKYSGTSSSGATIEGIGFAIPIDDLKKSLDELRTKGYISSAYLGIRGMDVSEEAVLTYGLPRGAYVDSVESGTGAAEAGIEAKDIIIAMGSQKVTSFSDLARILRGYAPGDETTVTVYRAGKELTLSITLGERPQEDDSSGNAENAMPEEGNFQEWFDYFNKFSNDNP